MASPFNDSEPESTESPDEEVEEDLVETGFDPVLFWAQYRQLILVAGGILVLALAGYGIYEYNLSQHIAAAGAALAQAANEDDYRGVIDKYPGTMAGGDASLLLAGALRAEAKYDDALQVLQDFQDKYPTHPLAHAGDLSYAETLEAQGRVDEAVARYEEVTAKYPDSYSAPLAVIAEANILKSQGKIDDARRLYENFVAQFPASEFTQEAMAEMHLLRPTASASASPGPGANSEGITSFLNDVRAAAASHAPGASPAPSAPAPIIPVVPGAAPH